MPVTISMTMDNVMDALGAYLRTLCFNADDTPAEVIRGQVNRVVYPEGSFIKLTEMRGMMLATSKKRHDSTNQITTITGKQQLEIQADIYGPLAFEWNAILQTVYRTTYTPEQFQSTPGLTPLYCSDGLQGPLVTGEEQYENRWTLSCFLEYNPSVSLAQQSATALAMNEIIDVP